MGDLTRQKCENCGRFMQIYHIECCVFPVCVNEKCLRFGKWPKELESIENYYKKCCERRSFVSSPTLK